MEDKIYVIYAITCKANNKVYIGQSRNIKARFQIYRSSLRHNNCHNYGLQEDYNKYGAENFTFKVIDRTNNYDELDTLETAYICLYDSVEKGYNAGYGNYKRSNSTFGVYNWNISLQKIKDAFEDLYGDIDITKFIRHITSNGKLDNKYYLIAKDERFYSIDRKDIYEYWENGQIYTDKMVLSLILNKYLEIMHNS